MGGRGSSSGSWKKQLKAAAKEGKMPAAIGGSKEQRKAVFETIDKLYQMSIPDSVKIEDLGDRIRIEYAGTVTLLGHSANPTKREINGLVKFALWSKVK